MNLLLILSIALTAGLLLIWWIIPAIAAEIQEISRLGKSDADKNHDNHGDGL